MQLCNFIDWRNLKIVYKRYASLYFVTAIDNDDNELVALDMIHQFVEVLDKHFSNVCELDLVFHFYKAYWLMDEVFLAGAGTIALLACVLCCFSHACGLVQYADAHKPQVLWIDDSRKQPGIKLRCRRDAGAQQASSHSTREGAG